jgi:hypothetical protein
MIDQLGLHNAKDTPLSSQVKAGPDVRNTMLGRFRPIELTKIVKSTVEFEVAEVEIPINTSGVVNPLSATKLSLKPEGERSWQWKEIWATTDLVLQTDDRIIYKGERYRIMSQLDWQENGFVAYEIVNDYVRQSNT